MRLTGMGIKVAQEQTRCIRIHLDGQSLEAMRTCDIVRLTVLCKDNGTAMNLIIRNKGTGTKHGEGGAGEVWMDSSELLRSLRPGVPIVFDSHGRQVRFSLEGISENHFLGKTEPIEETIIRCLERN